MQKKVKGYLTQDSLPILLERQIMRGYDVKEKGLDASSDYKYSSEDFQIARKLSEYALIKNGFKLLDEKHFENKIKNMFGFESEGKSITNFLIEYPCSRKKMPIN
ncbi:hypothetical protein [Frigoriflavimonas asaccharolytica]|uniref:Uncharacterized protein n=1 Tax=Frigoriflavimonas asaccharolytica TaxID=2735899 RepID=A0A8J8GBF0_9FLAO|nr:hypothetical protein [Frigoriflavimonas asaccharolytica]NRS94145.1 hypothetical protein [Frigoriflavimonas asaccharolytica]